MKATSSEGPLFPRRNPTICDRGRPSKGKGVTVPGTRQPRQAELFTKRLRTLLRRSKDATLGFTTRLAINSKLRGIGEMTELSIDTKKKRVRVRLELVGEAEPIEVEITKYNLKNKDSGARLTIEEATASREWLAVALREFVVGRTIDIPAKAGALLKLLT